MNKLTNFPFPFPFQFHYPKQHKQKNATRDRVVCYVFLFRYLDLESEITCSQGGFVFRLINTLATEKYARATLTLYDEGFVSLVIFTYTSGHSTTLSRSLKFTLREGVSGKMRAPPFNLHSSKSTDLCLCVYTVYRERERERERRRGAMISQLFSGAVKTATHLAPLRDKLFSQSGWVQAATSSFKKVLHFSPTSSLPWVTTTDYTT